MNGKPSPIRAVELAGAATNGRSDPKAEADWLGWLISSTDFRELETRDPPLEVDTE